MKKKQFFSFVLISAILVQMLYTISTVGVFATNQNQSNSMTTVKKLTNKNSISISRNGTTLYLSYPEGQQQQGLRSTSSYSSTYIATQHGSEITTLINDTSLPLELDYGLELPANWTMKLVIEEQKDGISSAILLLDENNLASGAIFNPQVMDADGNKIMTYFQLTNEGFELIVSPDDTVTNYPLMSTLTILPQYTFTDFFYTTSGFRTRDNGVCLTLNVNKGAAGWYIPQDLPDVILDTSWAQIYYRYDRHPSWYNAQGLYEQYECHYKCAWAQRNEWNLEPWRPCVGYVATVHARCNP